jgi:hypothetical protein
VGLALLAARNNLYDAVGGSQRTTEEARWLERGLHGVSGLRDAER